MKKLMILSMVMVSALVFGKTLEGTAEGRNGEIKLAVTLEGDKIVKINVLDQVETANRWKRAEVILGNLIGKTSTENIDTVSGATMSSEGILDAVNNALSKK